ncbi:MAG: hypothetical protein U0599_06800 [Vicinamibacteria bacterium]
MSAPRPVSKAASVARPSPARATSRARPSSRSALRRRPLGAERLDGRARGGGRTEDERAPGEAQREVGPADAAEVARLPHPALDLGGRGRAPHGRADPVVERQEPLRRAVLEALVHLGHREDGRLAPDHDAGVQDVLGVRVVAPLAAELAPGELAEEGPEPQDRDALSRVRLPPVRGRVEPVLAPGHVDEGVERGDRRGVELEGEERAGREDGLLGERSEVTRRGHGRFGGGA